MSSTVGIENLQIVSVLFLAIAIYISFKFFKCEKLFIYLAITIFSLIIILVNANQILLIINYWQNITSKHLIGIVLIGFNFYSLVYLLLPNNRKNISLTRTNIEAEENRKFQLKQLNR